jgi:phosphate transport system permease protein
MPGAAGAPAITQALRIPKREPHTLARSSNAGDRVFDGLTTAAALTAVGALVLIVGVLVVQSRETIGRFRFSFLTTSTWDPIHNVFGAAPAIMGTIYTSLLALLIAGPVGVMVAVFLSEIAPRRIRFGLGFLVELLAAVPSIVYGLWALYVLVPLVRDYVEIPLTNHFGSFPLFQGTPIGLGILTAVTILSIMILPTIAAVSRDALQAIPNSHRDAMLALGATRWETTWKVVVPAARSGIVGALILALGRAVGETMAVQLVIGNVLSKFTYSLFGFGTTLTATMVNQFAEATGDVYRSALIESALILMLVTVVLNGLARALVWRVSKVSG